MAGRRYILGGHRSGPAARARLAISEWPPPPPRRHLAPIDDETHAEIEAEIARGEFDGYSQMGLRYLGAGEEAE